ncbi:MAG: PIG-L deacetylase family protein [Dehalococcoidia bacterium]
MIFPEDHGGPGERIMVVVAHPDDAEFMCSGSVARWTSEGRKVIYALVTSGDKGTSDRTIVPAELAKLREQEQREVCAILGMHTVEFLRYEDGVVQNTLELRKDITRLIRKHTPSAVITQNPATRWSGNYVNHPDHRNTGDATMDAVFPSARDYHMFPDLVMNEGLMPHITEHLYLGARGDMAEVYFDISETIETKIRALKAHKSQVINPTEEFDNRIKEMAGRVGAERGMAYAESFKYFYLGEEKTQRDRIPPTPDRD